MLWLLLSGLRCQASERSLTVCFAQDHQTDFHVLWAAENRYATRIYKAIGVDLQWRSQCSPDEMEARGSAGTTPNLSVIGVEWAAIAPKGISDRVLATAHPFQLSGIRITLYEDHLGLKQLTPTAQAALLGHVLAHEIGHVLLRYDGHSKIGLMKAYWTANEQAFMPCSLILFDDYEAVQIRKALDNRDRAPVLLAKGR